MRTLADHGYRLGLRFDPLLYAPAFRDSYRELFATIFETVDPGSLHSVSYGPFRTPRPFFDRMQKLYPEEELFAGPLKRHGSLISYAPEIETALQRFCHEELSKYVPSDILFPCRF